MRRKLIIIPILFLMGVVCSPLTAQEKPANSGANQNAKANATASADVSSSDELAAVRQSSREFVRVFNKGDAKAVAALWTEDGDYMDDSGRVFAGRAAIEEEYKRFFAEHPGAKIVIVIDSVRLLSPAAAIEDGRAILDPAPAGAPAAAKYTAVHVKVGGKWLMSTVRDTRAETPSAYGNLQELEWMIGSWAAEEHGATMEATCRWVANKSFIERTYSVTTSGQVSTSGIQVIGWNPQSSSIQSWSFSSDGSHAVGTWTPRGGGWAVEAQGVLADGTSTSAVNLLTRLDDNACAWQSVERTVGGSALPDTDEIVLKRRSDTP